MDKSIRPYRFRGGLNLFQIGVPPAISDIIQYAGAKQGRIYKTMPKARRRSRSRYSRRSWPSRRMLPALMS